MIVRASAMVDEKAKETKRLGCKNEYWELCSLQAFVEYSNYAEAILAAD